MKKLFQTLRNFAQNNKPLFTTIIVLAIFTIALIIIAVVAYDPQNNHHLDDSEKQLQSDIQKASDNDTLKLNNVLVKTDDGWSLTQVNIDNNRSNYAMVIMHNDQLVLGPGSNFDIDQLADNNVPDQIIDYLFPDKPHWINFSEAFDTSLRHSRAEIRGFIQAYAYINKIDLNRVTMTGDIVRDTTQDPSGDNRSETLQFNFTINNDNKQFTFKSIYSVDQAKYTYQIIDSNGNIVYTSELKADLSS